MAVMSGTMIVGLLGLVILQRIESMLVTGTIANAVREAMLLLIAIGFIRIALVFLFQGVLKRLNVPRILADALFVVVLIIFALYRMNAVGVNLASIITTSAIVSGGIALSLREPLENLWGGIALQLDNTCRIGDWIRVDGVTGQIVGIRWRYLSLATVTNETVIIPNAQLTKNRVIVLARRGDDRVPFRRDVEFSVSYDVPPARVVAVVEEALARAEIRNVAANPPAVVFCTGFGDSAIHFVVRYGLAEPRHRYCDRFAGPPARRGDARAQRHGNAAAAAGADPRPHRRARPRSTSAHSRHVRLRSKKLELFAALTDAERRALTEELSDWPYVADDVIARQGEPADSMFILAHGRVGVFDDSASGTGARDRLATLEAPNVFGEMGLLDRAGARSDGCRRDRSALLPARQGRIRHDSQGAAGAGRAAFTRRRGAADGQRRHARKASAPTCVRAARRPARRISSGGSRASSRSSPRTVRDAAERQRPPTMSARFSRNTLSGAGCGRHPDEWQPRPRELDRGAIVADLDHQRPVRIEESRRFA